MNLEEIKYNAFISYRHSELDQFAAITLHKELEAFRLPKAIQKQLKEKGIEKKKIERVFRDRDELPITNNLADPITNALRNSEFLLVICSPRLKESLWCRKEIETFISMHGREHVFAVLIEGEPAESFPEELLYEEKMTLDENGVERIERVPIEPLAADIRGKNKTEMRKKIKEEVLRLAAPMFGCSYDDLKQRHRERTLRRIITAACAVSAVFGSFALISTTMALRIQKQSEQIQEQSVEIQAQAERIEEQYQEALKTNARQMAEDAFDNMSNGDMEGAVQTAYDALTQADGNDMPYTAEAEFALSTALQSYRNGAQILPQRILKQSSQINFCKLSPDLNTLAVVDIFGRLSVYDPYSGKELYSVEMTGYTTYLAEEKVCFLSNTEIVYPMENGFSIYNFEKSELREFESRLTSVFLADKAGEYLATIGYDELIVYDAKTMKPVFEMETEVGESFQQECEFSKELHGMLAVEYDTLENQSCLMLINLKEQSVIKIETTLQSIMDVWFDEEEIFYCGYQDLESSQSSVYCADINGNIKWEHQLDGLADHIITFGAESTDKLAYSTYSTLVILNKNDGSVKTQEDFGREIINYCAYVDSDYLTLMTREGSYYYYSPETETAITYTGKFVANSDNLKSFHFGNGYYISAEHGSDVVALYKKSVGKEVTLLVEYEEFLTKSTISPKGEYIASGVSELGNTRITISKVSDGSKTAEIQAEDYIYDFAINEEGELIVLTDKSIEVYRLEDGTLLHKELTTSDNSRLIKNGQAYVACEDELVSIIDVKSGEVISQVQEERIVNNGLLASTVDEEGKYYAFCDKEKKNIAVGCFEDAFRKEISVNINAVECLAISPGKKVVFVTYLDEKVEAYDITTGNLLTTYGILEGGVEKVTELASIGGAILESSSNAYLVNNNFEIIAFLQGYTDYCEKNDSFLLDDSYYVYEVERYQLEDLIKEAEVYLSQ